MELGESWLKRTEYLGEESRANGREHGRIARELKQLALNKGQRGDTKRPEEPSYDLLSFEPRLDKAFGGDGQGPEQDVPSFGDERAGQVDLRVSERDAEAGELAKEKGQSIGVK